MQLPGRFIQFGVLRSVAAAYQLVLVGANLAVVGRLADSKTGGGPGTSGSRSALGAEFHASEYFCECSLLLLVGTHGKTPNISSVNIKTTIYGCSLVAIAKNACEYCAPIA